MKKSNVAMFGILIGTALLTACTKETALPKASESPSPKSIMITSPNPSLEPTPSPSPTATPFDWATAEVTEDNVRQALEGNVGAPFAIPVKDETFRKFVSSYDEKGEYIEITVNPGIFTDEKDFVKKAGGSLIEYSKFLFENPEVYEITVNALINDVAGGENEGVSISWRRDEAERIDYDIVLESMFGDYTIPYGLARKYSLQKELYEGLADFELPQYNNL
ncbi:hypothetical protein BBD42_21640 [Paenibacillus sp. BIHB 4019]|uniref:Uncharacterized protein n=1 Tax=Paenibacillus sp. BIHB 4019 TaxID=1870819 RepID=A0A1B2DM33_9BACL|nr:hypothetical protein [Paenibacillus sp. BIHB 4019]ANY68780.1 hypothetical protein BBD42_21640 [Paenibacillus sp. BIHB 4019]